MVIAIILCGWLRRYSGKMPMGATCSAIISAACHQPLPDDQEAYKFPIQWGAVSHPQLCPDPAIQTISIAETETVGPQQNLTGANSNSSDYIEGEEPSNSEEFELIPAQSTPCIEPGHCSFTTARDVEPPKAGQLYA
jgi:hypothetical protein